MEKYDIFIQAGQSNAEGTGGGPVTEEYIPDERICYLEAPKTVIVTDSGLDIQFLNVPFALNVATEHGTAEDPVGDFSLSFSKAYIDAGLLAPDRKILIIRGAVGGTGFQKKHWGMEDILYLKMLEMIDYAISLNPENQIKGVLWHQGEHDAFEGNTGENYHFQFTMLINSLRERYNIPNLPFICGSFVSDWRKKNEEICEPILAALQQVAQDIQGEYVDAGDLLSNNEKNGDGDDIHFCRESLHILGRRYFQSYMKCLQHTEK